MQQMGNNPQAQLVNQMMDDEGDEENGEEEGVYGNEEDDDEGEMIDLDNIDQIEKLDEE